MLNFVLKQCFFLMLSAALMVSVAAMEAEAASLQFDPESSKIDEGKTVTVDINIDAGTKQIAGTDIYILYDSSIASLQSVTGGDYFPIVTNIPSTDKLYISGVIANPGEYKTGAGTVATLVFKGEKEGTTKLTFSCDLTQTETSKINQNDINATNIIDCSTLNEHAVTVSDGTGTTAATKPSTLPESGVYETMLMYSSLGGLLVIVGFGLRLLMRVV